MVRTRTKKGSVAKSKANSSPERTAETERPWHVWLMDFENELEERRKKMETSLQDELENVDRCFMLQVGVITESEANLLELPVKPIDSNDTLDFKGQGLVTSTALKPMPPPESKTTRQSRARTKNTRTRTSSLSDVSAIQPDLSSTRRLTRSSSQPRDNRTRIICDYQTPLNRQNRTMTAVTPKCDPYCPMPLKRYARQGEMAISLTGSPLMMTTSITEPNICLPLNNGAEVYSIQPTEGPCPDGIAESLDAQTKRKLQILRDNLIWQSGMPPIPLDHK
ncbi:Borealin [Frankliniella fusca]|uniref:Borealin n=1 Tax=Frankliniella fusca TaxID=407009 RepID=A0AAE1HZB0_9NEOP|nr:Borealin [Frankliniella fusca]